MNKRCLLLFVLTIPLFLNANGDVYFKLDSCKVCKKAINWVQFPIIENKIHFTPVATWNNYDKTNIGIAFYSKSELKNIDFFFLPMFGTGSKNLTGIANFKYTFPLVKVKKLSLGFKSRRFSYLLFPEDLTYNKVEPFISLELKKAKNNNHKQSLGFKSSLIVLESINKGRQTDFYYVNQLFYKYDLNKKKNNFSIQIDAKQGNDFALLSSEINLNINYPTKKNNALYIRLFGGGYMYSNFTGNTPNSRFQMSGSTNTLSPEYQKDYTFDTYYLDRNAKDPFFAKQVTIADGGFKSITRLGLSPKYLLALNITSDIPIPVPIEPWVNIAMIDNGSKPGFAAEFGASLSLLGGVLQFHLPFVTTKNISNNQLIYGYDKFYEKITFSLDLMKLEKLRKLKN